MRALPLLGICSTLIPSESLVTIVMIVGDYYAMHMYIITMVI